MEPLTKTADEMVRPSERRRLLIAEDDSGLRETLALEFTERGYLVETAGSLAEFSRLELATFHVALVDLKLGSDNGLTLVERLVAENARCRIVLLTGYGSIATAVRAIKLGAHDYLTKPASIAALEEALSAPVRASKETPVPATPASLAKQEREYIEDVLQRHGGNISQAAKALGLHRQSLQRKLRKYMPAR